MKLPIRVSARHLHVSKEDLAALFGKEHKLTRVRPVDQPGQFACEERVTIKTKHDSIKDLRIVGPEREATQVEITLSDAYLLKIKPPIKESVSAEGREPKEIEIIGPQGKIKRKAVIIALRHLHLNLREAQEMGLENKEMVRVKVSGKRALVFKRVLVRVDRKYKKAMHIDTDEANACGIRQEGEGELIR